MFLEDRENIEPFLHFNKNLKIRESMSSRWSSKHLTEYALVTGHELGLGDSNINNAVSHLWEPRVRLINYADHRKLGVNVGQQNHKKKTCRHSLG